MKSHAYRHTLSYFLENLTVVIGLVLIWRGVWYVLDEIDILFFGGNHGLTAVVGIILGLIVLYIPDHDQKTKNK
jgi:uncharacterized membrane protein HdeD (DUF308 family)